MTTNNPHEHIERTLADLTPTPLPDYLHTRLAESMDNQLTLPEKLLGIALSLATAAALFITISLTLTLLNAPPLSAPTSTKTSAYATPADLQTLLAAK